MHMSLSVFTGLFHCLFVCPVFGSSVFLFVCVFVRLSDYTIGSGSQYYKQMDTQTDRQTDKQSQLGRGPLSKFTATVVRVSAN